MFRNIYFFIFKAIFTNRNSTKNDLKAKLVPNFHRLHSKKACAQTNGVMLSHLSPVNANRT